MASLLRYLRDVDVEAISIVTKGANNKRIFLFKSGADDLEQLPPGRLVKADDQWSGFYCVVAEPGSEEQPGQGPHEHNTADVWESEEEIRKAAWRFMENGALVNRMHESMEPFGKIVENAVALDDFRVADETIRKGSWYVAIKPTDEGRERIAAGEWTGLSIQGHGKRVEKIERAEDDTLLKRIAKALGIGVEEDELCECGHHHEVADDEDEQVEKAPLTAAGRKALPKSSFVFPAKAPGSGSYPIHDRAHAANALARASGKPEESSVRKAVCSRYPDLPACKSGLQKESGTFGSTEEDAVDLNERVEKIEETVGQLAEKVEPLTKLPEAIEKLTARLPEPSEEDDKEKTETPLAEAVEKVAATQADLTKMQGELDQALIAINERVEKLSEGNSTQREEPVEKQGDARPAGDLTGLLA